MDSEWAADILGQHRVLFLTDEITEPAAARVIGELVALAMADRRAPITLFINSPGGRLEQALGICDVIRSLVTPVRTVVVGWAMSAAAVIAAAGTPGLRSTYPSSWYLLHQTRESLNGEHLILMDHKAWVRFQESLQARAFALLAEVTGKPMIEIQRAAEWDCYLTAEQAIGFGLADHLVGRLEPTSPTRKRPSSSRSRGALQGAMRTRAGRGSAGK